MMKALILALVMCSQSLFAVSVRLYNDSPFKLRAVIRGADGSYLGEMILMPEHTTNWSSDWQYYGDDPNRTLTPLTVYWYCLQGGVYGISSNIATGGGVTAEGSSGPRICEPPKKKKPSEGPSQSEEQLDDQNSASSSSS